MALQSYISKMYSKRAIPQLTRLTISIYAEVQEARVVEKFNLDRVSEADPRVEGHQLWTTMAISKAKSKYLTIQSSKSVYDSQKIMKRSNFHWIIGWS